MRTMQTMPNIVYITISNIAHTVYIKFTAFWSFSKLLFVFLHLGFYEISTLVMPTMLTMRKIVYIIISNIAQTGYIRFTAFWNFSKLLFCFTHFGFDEISTPVMRTMLTMPNKIYINISNTS